MLRTAFPLWLPKIIQHDDVSRFQGFEKFVSDISLEGLALDWPVTRPQNSRTGKGASAEAAPWPPDPGLIHAKPLERSG
jgi:hypothetical protein